MNLAQPQALTQKLGQILSKNRVGKIVGKHAVAKFGAIALLVLAGCSQNSPSTEPAASADSNSNTPAPTHIRIATESSYRPFSYLDSNGKHQGFEIDLIHALCDQMQAHCEISSQNWETLIPGLNTNKYDAIFASMSATDERRKSVNFSDPYFNNKLVLVGKKTDPTTMDTIAGKSVAVQQATVSAGYLTAHHPDALIKIYDKQVEAYLDLASGRAEHLLSDIAPALDWLKTPEGAAFEIKGKAIDIGDNVAIAMRKEDTKLAEQFNHALAQLKSHGEYDKIVAKYFDLAAINGDTQASQ